MCVCVSVWVWGCVCVCVWERERERKRGREGERKRGREININRWPGFQMKICFTGGRDFWKLNFNSQLCCPYKNTSTRLQSTYDTRSLWFSLWKTPSHQCDQMALSFVQYLAIYNKAIFCPEVWEIVKVGSKYRISLQKLTKTLKITSHCLHPYVNLLFGYFLF